MAKKRLLAVCALALAALAAPAHADQFKESSERLCAKLAPCARIGQDVIVKDYVRGMIKAGLMRDFITPELLIEWNGWENVTPDSVIPAGTRIYG